MENNYQETTGMEEVLEPREDAVEVVNDLTADTEVVCQESETQKGKQKLWQKVKALPKKVWIPIVAGIAVLVIVGIILGATLSNTYKTPLDLLVDFQNQRKYSDIVGSSLKLLNGFSEEEMKKIVSIVMESEQMAEQMEEMEESAEEAVEERKDMYGKNYKYSYRIEDKEKLEPEDLKDMKDEIKETAKYLKKVIDETDDYDSDDWEEMAEESGLSKAKAKMLVKAMEDLYKEWRSVKITDGYELTVTFIITGSELDEPEENEETVHVYKVNGRWVCMEYLQIFNFIPGF